MTKNQKKTEQLSSEKKMKEQLLHPDGTNAYFANYFSVEASTDDLVVGFGQKLPVKDKNKEVYEIRRRIAMTHKGAEIFSKLLNDAVSQLKRIREKERK